MRKYQKINSRRISAKGSYYETDRPDSDDMPHKEWKCPHCYAVNSMWDAECQFCDYHESYETCSESPGGLRETTHERKDHD